MSESDVEADVEEQTGAVMRNSALMATGTIVSRITGVARGVAINAAIGVAVLGDTYALGNSLPNIVYILVIGGALNAVFIPQLIRHMKHDSDSGSGYADRLITLVSLILLIVTVVAVIFAPLIVRVYATAEFTDVQLSMATAFARYCLPQILFYGLYTMLAQVLNARLHFGAPMFAPIVNNVVVIATVVIFLFAFGAAAETGYLTDSQVALLGIGTTLGVACQAAVLIPVLIRVGYRYRPRFDFRGHGLGKAGSLAGWTIGLVIVNQVGFVVISQLATRANATAAESGGVPGGLATYQAAFLILMLPHSVITISLVTALLPRMSKAAADGHLPTVAADISQGARLIAVLVVPCATFLTAFGPMIGQSLFGFGLSAGDPAELIGIVASVFGLALLPFSIFYLCLRGWYSVEDTRTPFVMTVGYNLIAIPLTFVLFALAPTELQVPSLALSYGLAYWITLALTWFLLRRRLGSLQTRQTTVAIIPMVLIGAVSAVVGLGAVLLVYSVSTGSGVRPAFGDIAGSQFPSLLAVCAGGIITVLVYLGLSIVFQVKEIREAIHPIRMKLRR